MSIEIKTRRLKLRLLKEEDIDHLVELNSDLEVRRFFPEGTQNREQTEVRMKELISFYKDHGLPCFAIFSLETGEFVGRCGFGPVETGEIEVGYLLHRKFWGQGIATEVLSALLSWAQKNINANYIIAFAPVNHIASQRVMQKCGMEHYKNDVGHGVQCCFYRVENKDI